MTASAALFALAVATTLGAGATWLARHSAWHFGIVSQPNPIVPQHRRPIAYLGGVGIAAGIAGALLLGQLLDWTGQDPLARSDLIVGGALFLALGIADDLNPFRPLPKFALQLGAAAAIVTFLETGLEGNDDSLLLTLLSIFWIVTVVNAVNVTDVCDGLATGLACIQFGALAVLAPSNASWALLIAGSCVGFLIYNAPAASIFLGDAGSHLLGFWLAALTLDVMGSGDSMTPVIQALLISGVPLFELIFVTRMRTRKGLPWWRGSPDHFSLRLQAAGFSRWATDALAWSAMLLLAGAALLLEGAAPPIVFGIVATLGGLAVWCWSYLLGHEVIAPTS
jgi:UDP-GlcNAc:undecaprenyl-phosphate/decaprenyl-phosphate GlcNAc-1-phosphate transferase